MTDETDELQSDRSHIATAVGIFGHEALDLTEVCILSNTLQLTELLYLFNMEKLRPLETMASCVDRWLSSASQPYTSNP